MPANNIINQKSGYFISMYSAHASIVENLIGKNGKIVKLLIDAGGLKAPKGSYSNKAMFNNYSPETNRTLHAKIIYLDKLKTLSLWTGNLRKHTLTDQENIIITKTLSKENSKVVKSWFYDSPKKEHLIINIVQDKIRKVVCSKSIWNSFKANLEKLTDDKLSL